MWLIFYDVWKRNVGYIAQHSLDVVHETFGFLVVGELRKVQCNASIMVLQVTSNLSYLRLLCRDWISSVVARRVAYKTFACLW